VIEKLNLAYFVTVDDEVSLSGLFIIWSKLS